MSAWSETSPDERRGIARQLWEDLGNAPVDEDECLDFPFLHFPAGTHRESVWHWFEETFDLSVHDDLMFGGSET